MTTIQQDIDALLSAIEQTPPSLISLANQHGFACIETWRDAARNISGRVAYRKSTEKARKRVATL